MDFWKKPEESNLTKPITVRVEFYENSLDTLNKKVSLYLLKKNEASKEMKGLPPVISYACIYVCDNITRSNEISTIGCRN